MKQQAYEFLSSVQKLLCHCQNGLSSPLSNGMCTTKPEINIFANNFYPVFLGIPNKDRGVNFLQKQSIDTVSHSIDTSSLRKIILFWVQSCRKMLLEIKIIIWEKFSEKLF